MLSLEAGVLCYRRRPGCYAIAVGRGAMLSLEARVLCYRSRHTELKYLSTLYACANFTVLSPVHTTLVVLAYGLVVIKRERSLTYFRRVSTQHLSGLHGAIENGLGVRLGYCSDGEAYTYSLCRGLLLT